jgi:hypothetical protein
MPDVAHVRAKAYQDWEKKFKRNMTLQERVGESVSWWLVIIAGGFFLLSAPHTMSVFNELVPNVGRVAPFVVEFGLFYSAFYRRKMRGKGIPLTLWALDILLFITAVLVNGVGSMTAVVSSRQEVSEMSIGQLISQFSTLPISIQLAFIMAPIAGLIIPIGTLVAGEGLATLFMERREHQDSLSEQWTRDRVEIEFEALRDAAVAAGVRPTVANNWARGILSIQPRPQLSSPSIKIDTDEQRTEERTLTDSPADIYGQSFLPSKDSGQGSNGQKRMDARTVAYKFFAENPDAVDDPNLSVRSIADQLEISKSVVSDVRTRFRNGAYGQVANSSNGHNHYEN